MSSAHSPSSDESDRPDAADHRRRLRPSGGYRKLRSYQVATVVYDGTVSFCGRFVDPRSRTVDQMVQGRGAGGRISPKAAAPQPPPAKPNCAR
jgi:hypothetical protein